MTEQELLNLSDEEIQQRLDSYKKPELPDTEKLEGKDYTEDTRAEDNLEKQKSRPDAKQDGERIKNEEVKEDTPDTDLKVEAAERAVEVKNGDTDSGGFKPFWEYDKGFIYNQGEGNTIGDDIQIGRERLMAPGMGYIDFAMDAVGEVPGLGKIDDAWDEMTKFKDPAAQELRSVASVILPNIHLGGMLGSGVSVFGGQNALARAAWGISGRVAADVAITGISDYSERDEGLANALDGALEYFGSPIRIPEAWKVMDGDSATVRTQKLQWEAASFGLVGEALGFVLDKGKKIMPWYKAQNQQAEDYLDAVKSTNPDQETVIAINKWREMAENAPTPKLKKQYEEFADDLEVTMKDYGTTQITSDPLESSVHKYFNLKDLDVLQYSQQLIRKAVQKGSAAIEGTPVGDALQKAANPSFSWENVEFKPELYSKLVDQGEMTGMPKKASDTARNFFDIDEMADTGSRGKTPAPLLSDYQKKTYFEQDKTTQDMVEDLTAEIGSMGKFSIVRDGVTKNKKQLDEPVWDFIAEAIRVDGAEEMKNAFTFYKYPMFRGFEVETLTPDSAKDAATTLGILMDNYVSADRTLAGGRLVMTTAKEIPPIAAAMQMFGKAVPYDHAMDTIRLKLKVLMDELGTQKTIAGWQLENQKKLGQMLDWVRGGQKGEPPLNAAEEVAKFQKKQKAISDRNENVLKEFDRLKKEDPEKLNVLVQGFLMSDGDINTLESMYEWFAKQTSLRSMFVTDKSEKSATMMAKYMAGIWYNNVISLASAGKAIGGNVLQLGLEPIMMAGGSMASAIARRDFNAFKSSMYAYSSMLQTQGKALPDMYTKFVKASRDPKAFLDQVRKDMSIKDDDKAELIKSIADLPDTKGAWKGQWLALNRRANYNPLMRVGNTVMLAADQYVATLEATWKSRMRAQWSVDHDFPELKGLRREARLRTAERMHYANVFDERGVIKDPWIKQSIEGITLNADSQVADISGGIIDRYPALTPFLAFGRTIDNWVQRGFEYTGIKALFPGPYQQVLTAKTDGDKIKAMVKMGIPEDDPHILKIHGEFKKLYVGQLAFAGLLWQQLIGIAMNGKIRGNEPKDPGQLRAWRENGIRAKSIEIGGKVFVFEGQLPLDPLLTLAGDYANYNTSLSAKDQNDIAIQVAFSIASTFFSGTPGSGLKPIIDFIEGDSQNLTRTLAGLSVSMLPKSGDVGVLANASREAQNDVYNRLDAQILNRIPVANNMLLKQRDFYTDRFVSDGLNPFQKVFNSLSPIKMYDGPEPWRQQLVRIGFPGHKLLTHTSKGNVEYTPELRDAVYAEAQKMDLGETVIKPLLNNPKYAKDYEIIDNLRSSGYDSADVVISLSNVPLYRKIQDTVKAAQRLAEERVLNDERFAHIRYTVEAQQMVDDAMKKGDVSKAVYQQQLYILETEKRKQQKRKK